MKSIKKFNKTIARRKIRTRRRIKGAASRLRLSVFRSNRYTAVQLINDESGKTLASVSSRDLSGRAGKMRKIEAARKVGELIAEKAKALGIKEVVFDRGAYKYHGRTRAVAEGAREKGLKI